jgi:PAS domain S-box-containing protein
LVTNAFVAVHSTAEPAFAVRLSGEIVAWNEAAEELLGYTGDEALGERCFKLLQGRDRFGNIHCMADCPIAVMARRREPAARFEAVYRGADGDDVPAMVTPLMVPPADDGECLLMHILQSKASSGELRDAGGGELPRPQCDLVHRLTPREIEVLRLLAAGRGTQGIAERLGISSVTVRNHVENLLRKLDVHSRLQAVALAHRSGLL